MIWNWDKIIVDYSNKRETVFIGNPHNLPESAWIALAIMGANSNAGNMASSNPGAGFTEIKCIYRF